MSTRRFTGGAVLLALSLLSLAGARAGELEQEFAGQLSRAQGGDVQAMYAVGEMYELGMGTANSRAEALKWYRAAAERGHPGGAYQVGYAHYWGKGVKRDRREAHVWFLRAAEAGSQPAMPYLSKMYALGQGVPQDKAKAAEWAERASTASNVHKPPPAPVIAPAPRPEPVDRAAAPEAAPEAEPEAKPQAQAKPEPKPRPKAQPEPEPKPKAQPKPEPKPAPKPKTKPQPKPKPKPSQPPARVAIDRLMASHWEKSGRPALYLPSSQTTCEDQGEQLRCTSAARRSSLLGRPYAFRLVATIGDFDAKGGFTITYKPEVTGVLQAPPGAYAEEGGPTITEAQLRERVERAPEDLNCIPEGKQRLNCTDPRGQPQLFEAVEPKPAEQAFSKPPRDSARIGVAPPPSPPQQPAEPEESPRTRTFGPRP